MTFWKHLAIAAGLSLAAAGAGAQTWPSSTVTIVVPFSPGGSNDLMARFLAVRLGERLGQTVIVENRPGAGTAVGASYVARSAPDGHTILFVSSSLATNAAFSGDGLPYNPETDLAPASMIARGNMAIVGRTNLPGNTLAEIAASGQPMFYGTFGVGSSGHVGGALLAGALGADFEPVHYPGGAEALLDLSAGRVDIVVGTVPGLMATIDSGGAVPLAVMGTERDPAIPDTPTVVEAGYPDAIYYSWYGIFVAAGTPPDVLSQVNAALNEVVMSPEGVAFFSNYNAFPASLTPEEFSAEFLAELAKWRDLVAQMDLAGG